MNNFNNRTKLNSVLEQLGIMVVQKETTTLSCLDSTDMNNEIMDICAENKGLTKISTRRADSMRRKMKAKFSGELVVSFTLVIHKIRSLILTF